MQAISQASEYAIRALTLLAQRYGDGDEYHLAREVAADLDVPAPFLSKILVTLVGRGVLESRRGRGGGFRLARPPEQVALYEVVDALEHLGRTRACVLGQEECSDERACPLHDFWKRASADWLARLTSTTLRDLVVFCRDRPEGRYPAAR